NHIRPDAPRLEKPEHRHLERENAALRVEGIRRVGVLAVLPVGLCFLPAFVLTGVIPVVIAVVHDVLAAL
ncbi:hypothetical protein AB0M46_45255, partial [Dactylosporangium sp. NPDC051485]